MSAINFDACLTKTSSVQPRFDEATETDNDFEAIGKDESAYQPGHVSLQTPNHFAH